MPGFRRLAALLILGAPLTLLIPRPVGIDGHASQAAAVAQAAPSSRIELYLPPARIAPPGLPPRGGVAAPPPVSFPRTPVRAAMERTAPTAIVMDQVGAGSAPAVRHRPGLFTVVRIGRRLLYRKGYLGDVPVHLVVADLKDPEIKIGVMVARGGIGSSESFASMIHRAQPAAAITGTFFGVHNGLPTGDLVVNGHAVYQGFVGTAVAFTEGNVVSFIRTGYKERPVWRFFDGVMRAGPLLVEAGRIAVGPREEGFVSLSAAARRSRTAVGITAGRKLLLLAVREPVSLWRLAKLMRGLGAYHAVAMDGGSSTGLYCCGRMVARPGRALTNALVIYAYRQQYQQARGSFLGSSRLRAGARPARPPARLVLEVLPAAEQAPEPTALVPAPVPGSRSAVPTGTDASSSGLLRRPGSSPPAVLPLPWLSGGTGPRVDGQDLPSGGVGAGALFPAAPAGSGVPVPSGVAPPGPPRVGASKDGTELPAVRGPGSTPDGRHDAPAEGVG